MPLTLGSRIGSYEVTAAIGAGGMGEVYRATDTNLKRNVAIKVLPADVAADPDRLARFKREAEVLASLNHPHIAQVYGLEKGGGLTALVMELVEGDDLSVVIARGPIPYPDAVGMARQIADALDAAHELGIIHRDLKPANIKLRSDGTVKVLDFGLAKATGTAEPTSQSGSQSPTMTSPAMTAMGLILGTAAYMSPEQAKGRTVDKRADIWAFGVVLFEMLTGRSLFGGEDVSDVLANVLKQEPDWGALPDDVPPNVRHVLSCCLQRDPKNRLRDMGDVRLALNGAFEAPATAATSAATTQSRMAWVVAGGALLVAAGLSLPASRHLTEATPAPLLETRTDIVTPGATVTAASSFALSPDGRSIVYEAVGDGLSRLWLRSLSRGSTEQLTGTEGASYPFWSPDGRSLAFFSTGRLKRLDLGSGAPRSLAQGLGVGGTWSMDDVIVVSGSFLGLWSGPASGGEFAILTTPSEGQAGHSFPVFLPDGRHFLFKAWGAGNTAAVYLGSIDSQELTRLSDADSDGAYLAAAEGSPATERGWVLWVRGGTLVGQRLNLQQRALEGDPVTIADGVAVDFYGRAAVSTSRTGMVAYRAGSGRAKSQLTWFDRTGKALGTLGEATNHLGISLSPDGRRVAVWRADQGNEDVWLLDGPRASRFTFHADADGFPVWSPDGQRIAFASFRTGRYNTFVKAASGQGTEESLITSPELAWIGDWSRDGRFLIYVTVGAETGSDIRVQPATGERQAWTLLQTPRNEYWPKLSPDGRWLAYVSDEAGRPEIFVRPFTPPSDGPTVAGSQWQVSVGGGIYPAWRRDGQELYFLSPAGSLMASAVVVRDDAFVPGTPTALFQTRMPSGGVESLQGYQYAVAPDGRFLVNTLVNETTAEPITVIQNWRPPAAR